MKFNTLITLMLLCQNISTYAQATDKEDACPSKKISLQVIRGGYTAIGDAFEEFNVFFKQNNIVELESSCYPNGVGFALWNKSGKSGWQFDFLTIQASELRRKVTNSDTLLPKLSALHFRIAYFREYLKLKRWYGLWHLGIAYSRFDFSLIDRSSASQGSFSQLLSNPNLSPIINIGESRGNLSGDARIGFYFRTQWLKKIFTDFDIGFNIGYLQHLSSNDAWINSGLSRNSLRIQGAPNVKLSAVSAELNFTAICNILQRN